VLGRLIDLLDLDLRVSLTPSISTPSTGLAYCGFLDLPKRILHSIAFDFLDLAEHLSYELVVYSLHVGVFDDSLFVHDFQKFSDAPEIRESQVQFVPFVSLIER
jgi:hypothetical protein